MDRNLSDVDKSMLVCSVRIQPVKLDDTVGHEVNEGLRLVGRELGVADVGEVYSLRS